MRYRIFLTTLNEETEDEDREPRKDENWKTDEVLFHIWACNTFEKRDLLNT